MKKFMLRFLANRGAAAGLVLLLLVILATVAVSEWTTARVRRHLI